MRSHFPWALLLLVVLGGCATKQDVRDLTDQISTLRATQEEMLREVQRQNAMIMDSLSARGTQLRGDITNQLVGIERQLVQIQELTGQGQTQLSQLRDQIRVREESAAGFGTADSVPAGEPEELLDAALESLERGSLTTARAGFEEFLRLFPQHPLAADAQFHVGETYEEEGEPTRALEAYARVLQLHPASARAPAALYRGAIIEAGRGNRDEARMLFSRIVSAYPDTPEAELAREQLDEM